VYVCMCVRACKCVCARARARTCVYVYVRVCGRAITQKSIRWQCKRELPALLQKH